MKRSLIFMLILSPLVLAANFSWSFSYGLFEANQVNKNNIFVHSDSSPLELTIHRAPEWSQDKFHEEAEQVVIGLDAYYD